MIGDNIIGANLAETGAIPNGQGILVLNDSMHTSIDTNVVAGNTLNGIISASVGTQLFDNLVGVTHNQLAVLGNGRYGIDVTNTDALLIGNSVGGSGRDGIFLEAGAANADVQSNFIGQTYHRPDASHLVRTNLAGAGNHGDGIRVNAANVRIIGLPGLPNDIENNAGNGITLNGNNAQVSGNVIGKSASDGRGNTGAGIFIHSMNDIIGGSGTNPQNIIGGNAQGIVDEMPLNTIENNLVGENNGIAFGNTGVGIELAASAQVDSNVIGGNHGDGVRIDAGVSNVNLFVNFIGIAPLGRLLTVAVPNTGDGLRVLGTFNEIGSTTFAMGNIISANGAAGVDLFGSFNTLEGNLIGTDRGGVVSYGNAGPGIHCEPGTTMERIGNVDVLASHNIISGNHGPGIFLDQSDRNTIINNYIGVGIDGALMIGNTADGVRVTGDNNGIGPVVELSLTNPGFNTIAFNGGAGVSVPFDSAHMFGIGNRINGNSIYANTGLGIDLGTAGVTPNDHLDPDSGPNRLQNFPVITTASMYIGGTHISATFDSKPNAGYFIDFYTSPAPDPSGHSQGRFWLADYFIMTNSAGAAAIDVVVPGELPAGSLIIRTNAIVTSPTGFVVIDGVTIDGFQPSLFP